MAYTRLLRAYYHAERAIPEGQQYRLTKATTPAQRKAVDAVIIEFFCLTDGAFHQKRADEEVERFQDKQRKAKASANVRWSHTERNAKAMRTQCEGNALQSPVSSLQTPENPPHPPAGGAEGFDAFWAAWPKHPRKVAQRQCRDKWRKAGCEPITARIVAHVNASKASEAWLKSGGEFIPAPLVYLNQNRWEAEPAALLSVPITVSSSDAGKTARLLAEQRVHADEVERQRIVRMAAKQGVTA